MKHLIDDMLVDCSTREMFSFSIRCAECGRVFKTRPVPFSKAGIPPASDGKKVVYDTLYEEERARARTAAVKEAAQQFNRCPICRRTVCNRCFLICEDIDMCRSCAARLHEQGSPVAGADP